MVIAYLSVLLVVAFQVQIGEAEESLFQSAIPEGYFDRTNLFDCPARFHQESAVTDFPHLAFIGWVSRSGQIAWKCSGSLIARKFVLTAAHCALDEKNRKPKVVRLGDVNVTFSGDDRFVQQFEIKKFVRHADHRFSAKYSDIALIELKDEVNFTEAVFPTCLWQESSIPYDVFEAAGFGPGSGGLRLQRVDLKVENRSYCSEQYNETRGFHQGIVEDQLCAFNSRAETCQGDIGSPLQFTLNTYDRSIAALVGVTSFGGHCGRGQSGVHQTIQPHLSWIRSVVNESLDLLECAGRFGRPTKDPLDLSADCGDNRKLSSRVQLQWAQDQPQPQCGGTLIDYNTVLTSASCTLNSNGQEPQTITILGQTIPIAKIARHPNYKPETLKTNIALIRLTLYLTKNTQIAPACLNVNPLDRPHHSVRIAMRTVQTKSQAFVHAIGKCDEQLLSKLDLAEQIDDDLQCWSTDHRMVPGLCEIDAGGPMVDGGNYGRLNAINVLSGKCGSRDPLITLSVKPFVEWIEAFVLDRSVVQ